MNSETREGDAVSLKDQLRLHSAWRRGAIRAIHDLRDWLCEDNESGAQTDELLSQAIGALETEGIRVAVAGDRKRGKTELINALFFPDVGRRLLPTSDGDAFCPVEASWNGNEDDVCLRLLPIESLRGGASLEDLKADLSDWVRVPLYPREPEHVQKALSEIHRTKPKPLNEARALGVERIFPAASEARDSVQLPCWRYAIVNFPHPLLKGGLAVLDLPGLNAMSTDPEGYHALLEPIDAVLFTVAADVGLTADDRTLWQTHLTSPAGIDERILVILTRCDLLDPKRTRRSAIIERLRMSSAETLGLELAAVYPVSARDALSARMTNNPIRLKNSGAARLTSILGREFTIRRRVRYRSAIDASAGPLIHDRVTQLTNRSSELAERVFELKALQRDGEGIASRLLESARQQERDSLEATRIVERAERQLTERAARCLQLLSADGFEDVAKIARQRIQTCWNSRDMRQVIRALMEELRYKIAQTEPDAKQILRDLETTYATMQGRIGLSADMPPVFTPGFYRNDMELLHNEATRWLSSGEFLLNNRRSVLERLERHFLQRAQVLFDSLREDWLTWTDEALVPAKDAIQRHRAIAERRMTKFEDFKRARQTAEDEQTKLEHERVQVAKRLTALRNIRNSLNFDPITASSRESRRSAMVGAEDRGSNRGDPPSRDRG